MCQPLNYMPVRPNIWHYETMPKLSWFVFHLASVKTFLMPLFNSMIIIFVHFPLGLPLYLLAAAPVSVTLYLHFWKFGRFFIPSLPFDLMKMSLLTTKTWEPFYMIINFMVVFYIWKNTTLGLHLQWKAFVVHGNHDMQNEHHSLKTSCSALCDPRRIFHVWMKQSFTIPRPLTSFHALSNAHPLLWMRLVVYIKTNMYSLLLETYPLTWVPGNQRPVVHHTTWWAFPVFSALGFAISVFF